MRPEEHQAAYRSAFGEHMVAPPGTVDARLIAIVFTNRCGSMLFTELIASSPRVAPRYEIFNGDTVTAKASQYGLESFTDYLALMFPQTGATYTAKVHIGQLAFLAGLGLFKAFAGGVEIVHVRRRDLIAQAVSHSIARQTGQWTSLAGAPVPVEPVYDHREIGAIHRCIEQELATFPVLADTLGLDAREVVFEDLLADPDRVLGGLWHAFGLPLGAARPETARHRSQSTTLNGEFARRFRAEAMASAA